MKRLLILSTLFFILSIPFTIQVTLAEGLPKTLGGLAFSDPEKIVSKSEAWLKRPIRYKKESIGSDVAMMLDQHSYPALLPFIQDYAKAKKLKISAGEGTCGPSEGMLNRKQVDIGGFCCPPSRSDRLPGLTYHTLGISPLAIFVHPNNPIDTLTSEQVRAIFRGALTRWSQLIPNNKKSFKDILIQPIIRLHCKTRPGHWRLILDNEDSFGPRINEVGTIPDMVSNVAGYQGAIGYEEIWMTINHYKNKGKVKILKIDGQDPFDLETLKSGNYPFYRVHTITTWNSDTTSNPKAQELVQHLLKKAGSIDPKFYIVPAYDLPRNLWKFKGNDLIGAP